MYKAGAYQCRVWVYLLVLLLLTSFVNDNTDLHCKKAFHFQTPESVDVDVFALLDADSILVGYKASVFSPVCGDTACRPVELDMYWDVLGNFNKFELPPDKELTKYDHASFTSSDYLLLDQLLKNKQPAFLGMDKTELVGERKMDVVDGYSGATISVVQDEVVLGAVYSCYTLWHIANGGVVELIQQHTQNYITPQLANQLIAQSNYDSYKYLLDHFKEDDFLSYQREVLLIIQNGEDYIAQLALEKMPLRMIHDSSFQDAMATLCPTLDYYAQKSLLRRLDGELSSEQLGFVLIESIQPRSSGLNDEIIGLFCQENLVNKQLFLLLLKTIRERQVPLSKEQKKAIRQGDRYNKCSKEALKVIKD
jgi:hypothetical protein